MGVKKQRYTEEYFSKFIHYNFKMEVEQTNFVTHLIITVQLK